MKIAPGALVSEMSGSAAGLTVIRGRTGQVGGRKGHRRTASRPETLPVRAAFGAVRSAWADLSAADRAAWAAHAGSASRAWGAFYGSNWLYWIFTQTTASGPAVGVAPERLTSLSVGGVAATQGVFLSFDPSPVADPEFLIVEGAVFPSTAARSGGRGLTLVVPLGDGVATGVDIGSYWVNVWGSIIAGQSLGVRVRTWSLSTRLFSLPREARGAVV